jgi:hypothetical protein
LIVAIFPPVHPKRQSYRESSVLMRGMIARMSDHINSHWIPRSAADAQFMDSNGFTVSPAGGTKATSPSGRSEHSNSTR